jgi:energy-coupling factor transport system permease protein
MKVIESFGHSAPGAFSKFIFYICLSLGAIFSRSFPFILGLAALGVIAGMILIGSARKLFVVLLYSLLLALIIFLLHLFSHDGKTIFIFLFLKATVEGAGFGLLYGMKLMIFAASGFSVLTAIDPFDLITPFERMARKSGPLAGPLSSAILAFFIAIRFLPDFASRAKLTLLALRSRGLCFEGGLPRRARAAMIFLPPLFAGAIRRAELAGMALDLKGYATRYSRAVLASPKIYPGSLVLTVVSFLVLIGGIQTR